MFFSQRQVRAPEHGFTLIELTVTVALVGLLAWVTVPLFEVTSTRIKEVELRSALRQIRGALDAYKAAADGAAVSKKVTESGYPQSLEQLTQEAVALVRDVSAGRTEAILA